MEISESLSPLKRQEIMSPLIRKDEISLIDVKSLMSYNKTSSDTQSPGNLF